MIPGADHFFSGHLAELGRAVEEYLDASLRQEAEAAMAQAGR